MVRRKIPKLTLGLRMLLAMHAAGHTSGGMAKRLKVSRHSATGWLYGRHQPNHATLEKWAEICDVDLDWLLHGVLEDAELAPSGMSREQLAQALVAQLLGDKENYRLGLGDLTLAELDLAPAYIDLTAEPARVIQMADVA